MFLDLMFVRPRTIRTTMQATNKMQQNPFTDLFKSALHVSGDKLAHPQEHFLTVYTAFGTMHRYCCRPVTKLRWNSMEFHLNFVINFGPNRSSVTSCGS